jgi:hypothetical protein
MTGQSLPAASEQKRRSAHSRPLRFVVTGPGYDPRMSLTGCIRDRANPVRQFLDGELPGADVLRSSFRAKRPKTGLDVTLPYAPETVSPAWATLGAAIDHRLRFALGRGLRAGSTVELGVECASGLTSDGSEAERVLTAGSELVAMLQETAVRYSPADRRQPVPLPRDVEDLFVRACFAAAWFEEVLRTNRLWPGTPLAGEKCGDLCLQTLLESVPQYAVDDLIAMVELADTGLRSVRSVSKPSDFVPSPLFAGSFAIGGADADWLVGDLLVDVKASVTPNKLVTRDIYQLAGYVLLDFDDRLAIDQVGWYLARSGWFVSWDVDEFLSLLGCRRDLGDLRERFAAVVGEFDAANARGLDRETLEAMVFEHQGHFTPYYGRRLLREPPGGLREWDDLQAMLAEHARMAKGHGPFTLVCWEAGNRVVQVAVAGGRKSAWRWTAPQLVQEPPPVSNGEGQPTESTRRRAAPITTGELVTIAAEMRWVNGPNWPNGSVKVGTSHLVQHFGLSWDQARERKRRCQLLLATNDDFRARVDAAVHERRET